jgi:hypothetical protein
MATLISQQNLIKAHPEKNLKIGSIGTIVCLFDNPRETYQVEFTDSEGRTMIELVLLPNEIEKI